MIKSIIAAKSSNNVIGKENSLVWHMPADLKRFKQKTLGHYIIMGRKTLESMDKPLPGRTTIVVTRNQAYRAEGCIIVHNVQDAFRLAETNKQQEVFILGGAEIYKLTINMADRMYLTEIKAEFEGDAFFPEIDFRQWRVVNQEAFEADDKNPYPYAFVDLERLRS